MTVGTSMRIDGVREALVALNKVDPKARRQFTKDAAALAQPMVARARAGFPELPPLSGMARGRLKWSPDVQKKIKFQISTKKPRSKNTNRYPPSQLHTIFRLVQQDGAGEVYDMAANDHTASGFVRNLGGTASRVLWPAVNHTRAQLERDLSGLLKPIMDATTRELAN
jgi:hypothetical protein